MHTVTTDEIFAALSKEEVDAALKRYDAEIARYDAQSPAEKALDSNPPEPDDPIAREIARLLGCYIERFQALCKEKGEVPEEALLYKPASPIEQAAFAIFAEALHDSLQDMDTE